MAQCRNGHLVDPGIRFCRQCGVAVAEASPATPTTVSGPPLDLPLAPETPPPAPLPPQAYATADGPQTHHSNTVVYAIAGVVILLGVIGIAVALILGSGNNGSQRPVESSSSGSASPTSTTSTSATSSPTPSASASTGSLPPNGVLCQGQVNGVNYGTFAGSPTSCQFAAAVQQAYVASGKQQNTPFTATSPVTNKTYTNVVCVSDGQWITCTSGSDPNNPARMFFAAQ